MSAISPEPEIPHGHDAADALDTPKREFARPLWRGEPAIAGKRSDSPWYPSARQFWQTSPGDWATPVSHVAAELAYLAG